MAQIVALWLQRGLALARNVGPYALIEILLPGGTLIALLLWLARRGAFSTRQSMELMPTHYAKQLDQPLAPGLRCRPMKYACSGLLTVALGWASVASAEVALHACELPDVKRPAKCGVVEVPENRDRPQGRRLQLAIAVVPAENPGAHDDPIVPLMGGPGEAAISTAADYVSGIGPLLKDRDLLLIDQRGTGKSNALRCTLYDQQNPQQSLHNLFPADAVKACAQDLSTRADLTQYGYPNFARDLEDVRRALGYGQLNITSGSYGTRAAQVYLRMYPQSVRTVLLHSVVPLDVITPLTMAKTAEAQRNKTFDACAANAACRATFPNLRHEFDDVVRELDSGRTSLDRGRVAEWFRSLTYRPYSATDMPWLIHRAHAGDWQPIEQGILENAAGADAALSLGLLFSITCNDDVAFLDEQAIVRESQNTFLRDYRVRQQQAACRQWPKNPQETDRTPVRSAVPTLFVSGDSDAATPLWFTARVAAGFSQRAEVIAAGQGHTEWSECVGGFYEQLVRDGSVRNLRGTTCDAIPRPAFKTQ